MDYRNKSREELIQELEKLERSNFALKEGNADNYNGRVPREDETTGNISRLAMAMKGGNMAWWEMDISNGMVTFDIRKAEMLGYPAKKFKYYWDFTELVHPDDYDNIMASMTGHFEGRYKDYEVEYRIKTISGKYLWFYDFGSVVKRDVSGRPLIATGFVYDITQRKESEELLQKSELMLQTVLNNFPGLVFWKDRKSVYLGCNQNFALGAGLNNPSEIVGKTDFELPWRLTEAEKYIADDKEVIESGKEKLHIPENQHQTNGKIVWLDTSKTPMSDSRGQIIGVIGVATDISLLKLAEDELTVANKNLHIQIEEKEKQAIDLIKAKERAEESDRLKSAFLSNLSHEIRTPMNGILSFAELLKTPDLSQQELIEFVTNIENSGERLLGLINNIISISRIESGELGVFISDTNINDQLESVYTQFKQEADEKYLAISVKNSLNAGDAVIKTDCDKVRAILANLVMNAIKFTQSGSVLLGCVRKENHLEFYVKDTGMGISSDRTEIIFEKFMQGSESLTRGYEGAGLGLSISKSYVEMLGGRIWVESQVHEGSVFYFTIPNPSAISPDK
jgi:PAS domain S-box-containing protein